MTVSVSHPRTLRRGRSFSVREFFVSSPDRLLVILFWLCLIVTAAILLQQFRPVLVLPAIVVATVAGWRVMPTRLPATKGTVLATGAALLMAAAWLAVNIPFASRYLIVDRDPGFLTLAGVWLSNHPSPDIQLSPSLLDAASAVPGLALQSPGYYHVGDLLYTQGAKLLPGLLAIAGWGGGVRGVMAANLVIGALALLSVYALGRRVVGPWWGLLPMVALGASLPFLAFTRAGYSEPITLALLFAGLVFVWDGIGTRSVWRVAIGGTMVGSAALARIDGPGPAIGLIAGLGLAAAFAIVPRVRRFQLVSAGLATVGALAFVGVGYLDLRINSPVYLNDLASQFRMLIVALVLTVVVAVFINLPRVWSGARTWMLRARRPASIAFFFLIALVAAILTSRPLWYVAHNMAPGTSPSNLSLGLQKLEHVVPTAATRSFDERSVSWISWYLGWPAVVLGFLGLAILGFIAVRRRDARYLVLLAVIGAPSMLYLLRVSITPDQIWAMRRFLPVTIPGLLVTAAVTLRTLWDSRRRWVRVSSVVVALAAFAFPVTTWGSLFTAVEHGGRYGQAMAVCEAAAGRPVIVHGMDSLAPTIRTICGDEVLVASRPLEAEEIALVEKRLGREVAVVTTDPTHFQWRAEAEPTVTTEITRWELTIARRPSVVVHSVDRLWIGLTASDGVLDAVAPIRP